MNQRMACCRLLLALTLALSTLDLAGCDGAPGRAPEASLFSKEERAVIRTLSPLPQVPPDTTNRVADNQAAAALGQMYYFDPRFSGPLVNVANEVAATGGNGTVGAVSDSLDGRAQQISCARCHDPATGFADQRTLPANTSLGTGFTARNSPTVLNAAYQAFQFHDGRADSLWSQALKPLESDVEMNFSRVGLVDLIRDKYAALHGAVFSPLPDLSFLDAFPDFAAGAAPQFARQGRPGDGAAAGPGQASYDALSATDRRTVDRIFSEWGKAIAAYERLIVSRGSRFDVFAAGNEGAISVQAQRGLKLFIGQGFCINCHAGPNFSENQFHNLGVAQAGDQVPLQDPGRFAGVPAVLADPFNGQGAFSDDTTGGSAKLSGLVQDGSQLGAFRTATLRSVNRTAPYMHTGSLSSLWDVVDFYNRGGDNTGFLGTPDPRLGPPLGLTENQVDDLVAFLQSLEGAPLPEVLTRAPALPR